jgi:cyclophilin family peptidyl-prolyl cis-trans isomerase
MPSHRVSRGTIALANSGPDQNGPEFFINLIDADYLTGKHTVIGQVVEGMDIADRIGNYPVDPLRFTRLSTVIYTIRRVE